MGNIEDSLLDFAVIHTINAGEEVCCDGCNGPYPENGDAINGGVIIGSSAYCQACSDKYGYDSEDYEHADEIDEIMDKEKTFKQNVLDYRKKMTGSTDGITRILSYK